MAGAAHAKAATGWSNNGSAMRKAGFPPPRPRRKFTARLLRWPIPRGAPSCARCVPGRGQRERHCRAVRNQPAGHFAPPARAGTGGADRNRPRQAAGPGTRTTVHPGHGLVLADPAKMAQWSGPKGSSVEILQGVRAVGADRPRPHGLGRRAGDVQPVPVARTRAAPPNWPMVAWPRRCGACTSPRRTTGRCRRRPAGWHGRHRDSRPASASSPGRGR